MKALIFTLFFCAALLAGRATPAEPPREGALTVRQYELQSFEDLFKASADRCTRSYPALKVKFDEALASLKPRASAALDAALETERFRSLADAKVAKEIIKNAADNLAAMRSSTANVPERDCKQAIDLAMSEELLRDLMVEVLEQFSRNPDWFDER